MCSLKFVHSQFPIQNQNAGCAHYSLFLQEQLFWKENLAHNLLNQCTFVHLLPHCLLTILNSKQLILLLVKKQDARFVHSRANHRFVLGDMTRTSARFPTQFMRKWIPAFSLLTGFINPQDYQG